MQLIDTFAPTHEQQAIIGAELVSSCIIACAGSGKTTTAVRRVLQVNKEMQATYGNVLLLSFSNVAVDTFRTEYNALAKQTALLNKARIETLDGFLANFIIRPHGSRIMGCSRQPFWISGDEAFLTNFRVWETTRPRDIANLVIQVDDQGFKYIVRENNFDVSIEKYAANTAINKLGVIGAYTYELGRYWAINLLMQEPKLLSALSKRFPHIIVDEAQDIGVLHECLLRLLQQEGSTITLIGDPNQAIFEFADADGKYLIEESKKPANKAFQLSENRRSLAPIVSLANKLTSSKSQPVRQPSQRKHGIFYVKYDHKDITTAVEIFTSILDTAKYDLSEAAILCRGTTMLNNLLGSSTNVGVGATALLAEAAVLRDQRGDISEAFNRIVSAIINLLNKPDNDLKAKLLANISEITFKQLRRQLWSFLRDSKQGLPSANLKGTSQWFVALKTNVNNLLSQIEATSRYSRISSWANRLTKAKIDDIPLYASDLATTKNNSVLVETVHKAKGKSISAVMYLARTEDINNLLTGTLNEEGRIGYVAITRAKDLLILGVPNSAKKQVIESIEGLGFQAW
ncbi:UvrD-helicase domain-containing protein [Methylophilus sp. 5]|uniref:UvrD-helicase domain-containing protein n=1 Tax=Methylophilus sp. 5 TaxID=1112274 RepID=UPI00048C7596|nr:ATP-dependent helicase [Methylophilus sp. 5]